MFNKLINYIFDLSAEKPTFIEILPLLSLLFIVAFCFNILPPSFNYYASGQLTTDDINPRFNQFFWILSFFSTVPLWLRRNHETLKGTYVQAIPLLVLTSLLFLSALWSLSPMDTIRRSVLQILVIFTVLSNVASLKKLDYLFIVVYTVATITLIFEIIMLFKSNGFDEMGFFRGIHTQKNVLGFIAAISIFFGFFVRSKGLCKSNKINTFYLVAWLSLLLLSRSKTSLLLLVIAPLIAIFIRGKGRTGLTLLFLLVFIYCVIATLIIFGVDVSVFIQKTVHQAGFTGRDDIWQFLIARFSERPWLGHGYGGFWDIGLLSPNIRYGTGFIPFINQAHNGYLDLILSLGILGAAAYLMVLVGLIVCLGVAEHHLNNYLLTWSWILIMFSLLHNLTETTLLRPYSTVWLIQLLAMATIYRMSYEVIDSKR